jgi:CRP/FNR family transcriptional regulator
MLFVEGQGPRGIFVLCSGKAKLSTSSRNGKTVITAMASSGDVLGLSATISNHPY